MTSDQNERVRIIINRNKVKSVFEPNSRSVPGVYVQFLSHELSENASLDGMLVGVIKFVCNVVS